MARPSKYETHVEPYLKKIKGWKMNGVSDEEIAKNLGVAYSSFKEYKKKYMALMAVLKTGREEADMVVLGAFYQKAAGLIDLEDTTYETKWNEKTQEWEEICTKRVIRRQAPDTGAAFIWLKNRMADQWRDRQEVSHNIDYGAINQLNSQYKDTKQRKTVDLSNIDEE